jgi:glycosyltransferase involved in cell wall biosynthesis
MRVLLNGLQAANRSGTGRHVTELVCALATLTERPDLHIAWPEDYPHPAEAEGMHYAPFETSQGKRMHTEQWTLPRLARRIGANAMHYPANSGLLRNIGCAQVLTVHDCSFVRNPTWFRWERAQYHRMAVRRSVRLAAQVIAVSQFTADDLIDWLGITPDRVHVIHNGVDPRFRPPTQEAVDAVRTKYGLPDRFFLFVGTLEPRKNLPRLLAAHQAATHEGMEDALVVAGRFGWKLPMQQLFGEEAGHAGRVCLLDHVPNEDLPALYGAARAFVWPSLFEGFGLPVLEAMACGAAVLTSNTTALPEIAGDAAWLVNPEDEDEMAAALLRLSHDDELLSRLRAKGPARAAKFTWEAAARATVRVYGLGS